MDTMKMVYTQLKLHERRTSKTWIVCITIGCVILFGAMPLFRHDTSCRTLVGEMMMHNREHYKLTKEEEKIEAAILVNNRIYWSFNSVSLRDGRLVTRFSNVQGNYMACSRPEVSGNFTTKYSFGSYIGTRSNGTWKLDMPAEDTFHPCEIHPTGFEDPRTVDDAWIMIGFRGMVHGDCKHHVLMFTPGWSEYRVIEYDQARTVEKNWMAFVYNREQYFHYSLHPEHIVLKCREASCDQAYANPGLSFASAGGGVTPYNDTHMIGVAHTRIPWRQPFFFLVDNVPPFHIRAISDTMSLYPSMMQFPTHISHEENAFRIFFGVDDCFTIVRRDALETLEWKGVS